MNKQDLDVWIKELKDQHKLVDAKVIDFDEQTGEANILIKPIPVLKKIKELCKHGISIDEICDDCAEDMGLTGCEQCDEIAWDGRICHSCGAKNI